MAQQVKVLTIKPGDLSPILWTHMVEGDLILILKKKKTDLLH